MWPTSIETFMIKNYTLMALEAAINQALALDSSLGEKMQPLDGKILKMVVMPLHISFFIRFTGTTFELLSEYEGYVDTTIHSSPLGLIRLSLLPSSKVRSLFNDKIQIQGDVELGQNVKKLFDELQIDWEGHLAQFTGDVVAHQIGSFFRQGLRAQQQVSTSLRENLTEYLQEELRLFPPREEMEDFFNDVDELTLHVERLTAHINQLLNRHEAS
jgi:ubiquinone biosynthesis protein UbiJ